MTSEAMTIEQRRQRNAGPLVTGWEVARAVVRTLALRLPPWLDEAARQQGLEGIVPRPHAVVLRGGTDDYGEDVYPGVVVSYRATRSRRRSDGEVESDLQIRVVTIVDENDRDVAMRTAALYETAIQACLVTTLAEYAGDLVRGEIEPQQSGVEPRAPSGATADVQLTVTAGPTFSRNGYLAPLPGGEQTEPDDQGDQAPITNVELVAEPQAAGASAGDES